MEGRRQILRYLVVGALGFSTDGGLLYLLTTGGWDPYWARAVSFPVAATVTYFLNRMWTFQVAEHVRRSVGEYSVYILIQIAGALTNLLIYGGVLTLIGVSPERALLALAVGAVFGLMVNFFGARALFHRNR